MTTMQTFNVLYHVKKKKIVIKLLECHVVFPMKEIKFFSSATCIPKDMCDIPVETADGKH